MSLEHCRFCGSTEIAVVDPPNPQSKSPVGKEGTAWCVECHERASANALGRVLRNRRRAVPPETP